MILFERLYLHTCNHGHILEFTLDVLNAAEHDRDGPFGLKAKVKTPAMLLLSLSLLGRHFEVRWMFGTPEVDVVEPGDVPSELDKLIDRMSEKPEDYDPDKKWMN